MVCKYTLVAILLVIFNCYNSVLSKRRRSRPTTVQDPAGENFGLASWRVFKNLATSAKNGESGRKVYTNKDGKVVCKCPRGPPGPSGPRGPPGAEVTEAHLLAKFRALIRESSQRRSTQMRDTSDQALALMATGAADLVSAFHIELKNHVQVPKKNKVELKNYKTNVGQYGTFVRGDDIDFRSGQFTVPYTAIYRFSAGINIARHRDASLRPRDLVKVLICIEFQCDRNTSLMTVSGLSSNSRVFTVRVEGLLSLKMGQRVSIFVENSSSNSIVVQSRSTFTGMLIGL